MPSAEDALAEQLLPSFGCSLAGECGDATVAKRAEAFSLAAASWLLLPGPCGHE